MSLHVAGNCIGVGRSVKEIVSTGPQTDHCIAWNRGLNVGQITGDLRPNIWNEQVGITSPGLGAPEGTVGPARSHPRTNATRQPVSIVEPTQPHLTVGKTALPVGWNIGGVENGCFCIPHVRERIAEGQQRACTGHLHVSKHHKMQVAASKNRF